MPRIPHRLTLALLLGATLALLPSLLPAQESPSTSQPATPARTSKAAHSSIQLANTFERRLLDRLTFDSTMDPPPKENQLVFPDVTTAIHLNKFAYASNEPITAYAIVKLTDDKEGRSIPVSLWIGDPGEKTTTSGSARLQILRQLPGNKTESVAETKSNPNDNPTPAARNRMVLNNSNLRTYLAAGAYWVTSGDLRNLASSKLAPGNYLVRFWAEGQRSEAAFTITADKLPETPASQPATISTPSSTQPATTQPQNKAENPKNKTPRESVILQVQGGWGDRKPELWPLQNAYPSPRITDDFVAGLNLGVGTGPSSRYFMRLDDIPASKDDSVAVSLSIEKSKEGLPEKIKITLSSVDPKKPARIPTFPVVYFFLENMDTPLKRNIYNNRAWMQTGGDHVLTKPVTLEISFQPRWDQQLPFKGKARISAIVAGVPVPPAKVGQGEEQNFNNQYMYGIPARNAWKGIVRTETVDINITPSKNNDAAAPAGVILRRGIRVLPAEPAEPAEEN